MQQRKRVFTLSEPPLERLSACVAALELATARRNKAEKVLEKASVDAEFAREEVTRLVSEKLRVEQSLLSTQSAPSYIQSLTSSSPGVDENIVAQAKNEMETLFNKLNGLTAAVASASSTSQPASSRSNTRCASAPPSPSKNDSPYRRSQVPIEVARLVYIRNQHAPIARTAFPCVTGRSGLHEP